MTEATWHRHRQETNNNKSTTYNTNLFTLNLPPPPAPPSKTSSKTGLYSLFPIHHLHSTELPLPRSATPSMVPNLMSISTSSLHLATLAGFASWPLTFLKTIFWLLFLLYLIFCHLTRPILPCSPSSTILLKDGELGAWFWILFSSLHFLSGWPQPFSKAWNIVCTIQGLMTLSNVYLLPALSPECHDVERRA